MFLLLRPLFLSHSMLDGWLNLLPGGTLLQCRAALESAGATQVSVFVTHAVFPQESWRRFEGDDFQFFYTTDSCPEITEVIRHKKPFHILPLAHDLVETAVRYSP